MRTMQLALTRRFMLLACLARLVAGVSFCTRNSETKCILSLYSPSGGPDVDYAAAAVAAAKAAGQSAAGPRLVGYSAHNTVVGTPDNGSQCISGGGRLASPLPLTITTPIGDTVRALQSALGPVVLSGDPFRSALFLSGWSTWGCNLPAGAPLLTNAGPLATATFTMPPWATGFTMETEPNSFASSTITAAARDSLGDQASLTQDVAGNSGAKAFTFVTMGAFLTEITFAFPAAAVGGAFARGFIQGPLPMDVKYIKVRAAKTNNSGKGRWAFQSTIRLASASVPLDAAPVSVAIYGPGGVMIDDVPFPAGTCESNSARTGFKCAQPNVGSLRLSSRATQGGGSNVTVKASLKQRAFDNISENGGPLIALVSSPALGTRTDTASACKHGRAATVACKRS